jgi:hypothetical protein
MSDSATRYLIPVILALALCMSAGFARGDLLKSDYAALQNLEQEFLNIAADVRRSSHAIENLGGAEYACVESTYHGAFHMAVLFGHYKFSEAITAIIVDQNDREHAKTFLKIETVLALDQMQSERNRINGALGACSKFPLAVAKGTELLAAMKKADSDVRSILGRISPQQ